MEQCEMITYRRYNAIKQFLVVHFTLFSITMGFVVFAQYRCSKYHTTLQTVTKQTDETGSSI